jgi:hypothetical protein
LPSGDVTLFFLRIEFEQGFPGLGVFCSPRILARKVLLTITKGESLRTLGIQIIRFSFFASLSMTQVHAEGGAALFGAAALTGAVGGIVSTGAQIGADKYINRLSAETAMYNTDAYTSLSRYQAGLSSAVTLGLAGMQLQATYANQYSASKNLDMVLQAQDRARFANQQASALRLKSEYALYHRQLDLQFKALDQQFALSMAPYQASGLFRQASSDSPPSVRSYGLASQLAQTPSDRLVSNLPTATLGFRGQSPPNAFAQSLLRGSRQGFRFAGNPVEVSVSRASKGVRGVGELHVAPAQASGHRSLLPF